MRIRKLLVPVVAIGVVVVVALLLCEVAARLVLRPADYLQVEMVLDPIMGAVPNVTTRSHGFDAWGFRNPSVPDHADIVAIGDSHTYGNTATMQDAWPAVVARITGASVYNMALGGYGPNQYYHLFETKALSLKPRTIILGLYMGDDFENAFLITYGLDYWKSLRALSADKVNFDIWEAPPAVTWHKKIRLWLSRHSMTYQLLFHGPLLGRFQGEVQIRNASDLYANRGTQLVVPEKHIEEAFLPTGILKRVDQNSESVREGMRITFELIRRMSVKCHEQNITFIVAVIPTKEMVFAEYLEHKPQIPLDDVIDKLLASERIARDKTFGFLTSAGIPYVDTLPALRRSLGGELYARTATDMHPNKNGYRIIAEEIAAVLKRQQQQGGPQ